MIVVRMIGGMMMSDKMHPRKAWQQKQLEAMNALLKAEYKNPPQTQREKDILNLKYMMYNIGYGSLYYRMGCYATLKRMIYLLEREDKNVRTNN